MLMKERKAVGCDMCDMEEWSTRGGQGQGGEDGRIKERFVYKYLSEI